MLSPEDGASAYDGEVDLYTALNSVFKIPVIENEYQKYKVSKVEDYDYKTALGYKTEIESLWAKVKIFMNLIPYCYPGGKYQRWKEVVSSGSFRRAVI